MRSHAILRFRQSVTIVMKLFKYSIQIPFLLMLSACAHLTTARHEPVVSSAYVASPEKGDDMPLQQESEKAEEGGERSHVAYPNAALTPDVLFGIVASEIAAQRGAAGSSAVTYLDLARQTRDPRMAQRAAEFALFSGQLDIANEALELWVQTDPTSTVAREQLLITLLRLGKLASSRQLIDAIASQEPKRVPALFMQLVRLMSYQQDKAAAYTLIRELLGDYAHLPEAQFALIAVAVEVGDSAVVDKAFDRLAFLAPQWDLPIIWQADRLSRKNPEAAILFLQRELARRPKAGLELRMALPKLLLVQKQFVDARAAFEVLLTQYPRHPDLLYACGLLAYQLKDLVHAKQRLEAALEERYHDLGVVYFILGQIAEEQQEPDNARNWYQKVVRGDQYFPAQVRLAYLDAQTESIDQVVERLDGLGTTEPERVQIVLLQSQLAREAKRYDLAYKVLDAGLYAFPNAPELLYEYAVVAELAGNVQTAERYLKRFLKEKPDNPMGLNALGYILASHTTRYHEAFGLIDKALKQDPNNPLILDSMGWVQYRLGHLHEALSYLAQAYAALRDPEVAAHYGEVLWRLGRNDEARAVWENVARDYPDNRTLQETMQRLWVP